VTAPKRGLDGNPSIVYRHQPERALDELFDQAVRRAEFRRGNKIRKG
jgi:hypothetical protein